MKIFLDFDDVTFNTKEFLVCIKNVFSDFGVSEDLFRSTYEDMRGEAYDGNLCYRFEKHISKIEEQTPIDSQALLASLEVKMTELSQFLFPDVRDFLISAKNNGYIVDILSFGDDDFQGMKIRNTGIGSFVERILVTQESKEKILVEQGIEAGENIWFFDDRVFFLENMKKAFPFIHTVLVTREEGRFSDMPSSFCDYQVGNLEEGKVLLQDFISY